MNSLLKGFISRGSNIIGKFTNFSDRCPEAKKRHQQRKKV